MGISYFNNLKWGDLSREERYFCQHLFDNLNRQGLSPLFRLLKNKGFFLSENKEWDIGYEVCFYRDLAKSKNARNNYSPKRTFDLCLFSNDEIVVIEAKAHGKFYYEQLKSIDEDNKLIPQAIGINDIKVHTLGIISSKYTNPPKEYFSSIITWHELAEIYKEKLYNQADNTFDSVSTGGLNNKGGFKTGNELLAIYRSDQHLYVGRNGGISGKLLHDDIENYTWKSQQYETNDNTHLPLPNSNWFTIEEFILLTES